MEDVLEYENSTIGNSVMKDDGTQYIDCIRLVEGGHLRRFENFVKNFDILQYESNDEPTKPLLFYAIERNNEQFVKFLLQMEIPLKKSYTLCKLDQFLSSISISSSQ
ncbi:hypothetical protein I4U23_007183 [Adineta vaga]|nr:hypothetical protein I4U23_007183 [Adineta vaga]